MALMGDENVTTEKELKERNKDKKMGWGMTDISDATTRTMDIITLKQPLPQLTHSQPFPHHGKRFQFAQSNS